MRKSTDLPVRNATAEEERATTDALHRTARPGGMSSTLEKENLEVAKENNEIAQERYEIGLSNALELRESQINLINAELRAQNAAFAAKVAEITLQFLAGTSTKSKRHVSNRGTC